MNSQNSRNDENVDVASAAASELPTATMLAGLLPEERLAALGTSLAGLSSREAEIRLARYGPNRATATHRASTLKTLLEQFIHTLALLLWFAMGLAFASGLPELGFAIAAVLLINGLFAFAQEYRADRVVEALSRQVAVHSRVVRDGSVAFIPATELVPGDVIHLFAGDFVPADCTLVASEGLSLELAAITGESAPVRRDASAVSGDSSIRLFELESIAPSGSAVVTGSGIGAVFATGAESTIGAISTMLTGIEQGPSILERQITGFSRITAAIAVITATVVLSFVALTKDTSTVAAITFGAGVIVALVPEGLLPTLSISLAAGASRMAKRKAAVRRLASVEIIGSATVICTDKTGTLTQNALSVAGFTGPNGESQPSRAALHTAALCNDARFENHTIEGDPVDRALLNWVTSQGLDLAEIQQEHPRQSSVPFTADRRYMEATVLHNGAEVYLYKGAPEAVTAVAGIAELPAEIVEAIGDATSHGQRVLMLAEMHPGQPAVVLGIVRLHDPPRPEALAAIAACREAGIRVVMLTGDHQLTASAIANSVGLRLAPDQLHTGLEIDKQSNAELLASLDKDTIVARADPGQKLRIVRVLRRAGEIVVVTGDGINDAPALRAADVGVAMGMEGTEVAKQSSDIILGDDNFATIVAAIEEGRAIKSNIRRFISYVVTSNVAELAPFVLFIFLPVPLPLSIMQVLAVDLGTDMIPAMALGLEPASSQAMRLPPEPPDAPLLTRSLAIRSFFFFGLIEAALGLGAFFSRYLVEGWRPFQSLTPFATFDGEAATMTFLGIVSGQIACLVAQRDGTLRQRLSLRSNPWIAWGLLFEILLALGLVYLPRLNGWFDMEAVALPWLLVLPIGALIFTSCDLVRRMVAGGREGPTAA